MAIQSGPRPYADQHRAVNGPGDDRPTALQIIRDNDLIGNMTDKTFLVTGGTSGLGLETVRQLAKTGAHVFFTARNEEKAKQVLADLNEEATANLEIQRGKIEWVEMDNCSLKKVKDGAEDFLKRSHRLNVLICNAGTSQTPFTLTEDGFEEQFAANHLAHFALFHHLAPLLLASSTPAFNSRLVVVASASHQFSTVQLGNYALDSPPKAYYDPWCAMPDSNDQTHNPMILYGSSKTAQIWFANQVERRYGARGLHALSLHPGVIVTAGFGRLDPRVMEKFAPLMGDPEMGKEFEGFGGLYLDACGVAEDMEEGDGMVPGAKGCREWIRGGEGEEVLWSDSCAMTGVGDGE